MADKTLAVLLGLGFGVSIKIADMVVDDGLRLFRCDGYLFGMLWGLLGWAIVFLDDDTGAVYATLLAYWLIRGKLDHAVHHLGGVLLILATFLSDLSSHFPAIIALLLFYECSYHVKRILQTSGRGGRFIQTFFRYKVQFLLPPLGLSLAMFNLTPFLVVVANMFGIALAHRLFQRQLIVSNYEGMKEGPIWEQKRRNK